MKYQDHDIDNWPDSWKYIPEDINIGKVLIKLFIKYIKYLKSQKLSQKTINNHIDNLWLLGGYIIKQTNLEPELRKRDPLLLIPRYIDSIDGPTLPDLSEYDQESFNKTCRKYYRYLVENDLQRLA
jgi:hypothetical protein